MKNLRRANARHCSAGPYTDATYLKTTTVQPGDARPVDLVFPLGV
jgi:hypothetical protein